MKPETAMENNGYLPENTSTPLTLNQQKLSSASSRNRDILNQFNGNHSRKELSKAPSSTNHQLNPVKALLGSSDTHDLATNYNNNMNRVRHSRSPTFPLGGTRSTKLLPQRTKMLNRQLSATATTVSATQEEAYRRQALSRPEKANQLKRMGKSEDSFRTKPLSRMNTIDNSTLYHGRGSRSPVSPVEGSEEAQRNNRRRHSVSTLILAAFILGNFGPNACRVKFLTEKFHNHSVLQQNLLEKWQIKF